MWSKAKPRYDKRSFHRPTATPELRVPQSVMSAAQVPVPVGVAQAPVAEVCTGLLDLFAQVGDGRCDQGRDHPVAAVLALAAATTVAGMTGYTAIAGWVGDVPVGCAVSSKRRRIQLLDALTAVLAGCFPLLTPDGIVPRFPRPETLTWRSTIACTTTVRRCSCGTTT